MPTIKKGPPPAVQPGQVTPRTLAKSNGHPGRPILYGPDKGFPKASVRRGAEALTVAQAKELLGWEIEADYTARRMQENPKLKKESRDATFGEEYTLIDEEGQKVRCWNNAKNRPFDDGHARKLAQDVLNRHWRFNFENIIIGITGLVLSGQHRLIGLVLAEQMRLGKQKGHWEALGWTMPVTIEVSIGFGAPEDADVLQTFDNVKPRTLADVLYTSDIFAGIRERKDRAELSRMLDAAIDLLWKRLGAGKDSFHKYQTHSESQDFLVRHHRLLQCVKHLWEENKNRGISHPDLRLSPGQCAAACYLMGCSASDETKYREAEMPQEKLLDWSCWDRAKEFWSDLSGNKKPVGQVRLAIKNLKDETELTGRMVEKLMVVAKAWDTYKNGKAPSQDDCELSTDHDGALDEWPGFGGVDLGPPKPKAEAEPIANEEERQAEARRIRAENLQAKVEGPGTTRLPGEVAKPEPIKVDKDGKPPPPKLIKPAGAK